MEPRFAAVVLFIITAPLSMLLVKSVIEDLRENGQKVNFINFIKFFRRTLSLWAVIVFLLFFLSLIMFFSSERIGIFDRLFDGGETDSYYIDYDGDGEMDKGEHVYDEEEDGTIHWDSDGDGWWDENDND